MLSATPNPAVLHPHNADWPVRAARHIDALRDRIADLPGASQALFDHIGSTSVPGLAAKPMLDLQLRILPLPADDALIARLAPLGYERVAGARADSPGVNCDIPRGNEPVDDDVWEKSLFVNSTTSVILHVRRADSPWGRYTVWFRDWLRENPLERERYEELKRRLSEENAGKADYDDYTRAKTAFFDRVQSELEEWGARLA